jgi:hypothetical protein
VSFTATDGSFDDPFDPAKPKLSGKADTTGGKATIKLYSSLTGGNVTVTGSYVTPNGDTVTDSITIIFNESSKITNRDISFLCDSRNIGALDKALNTLKLKCPIKVKSTTGGYLSNVKMKFLAEAGSLELDRDDSTGMTLLYTTTGNNPKDVDPLTSEKEPSYEDQGQKHNPRDGLATLVVAIRGMEWFDDVNGDGKWEPGEPFDDIGAPFVDENDNGVWDNGEPFYNMDGIGGIKDNAYHGPDGVHHDDWMVWKTYKLLWTGPMKTGTVSNVTPTTINMQYGEENKVFTFVVADENLNALAVNSGTNDEFDSSRVEAPKKTLPCDGYCPLKNSAGMTILDDNKNPGRTGDWKIQGPWYYSTNKWLVTLSDDITRHNPPSSRIACWIKTELKYTPAPTKYNNVDRQIAKLGAEGYIEGQPDAGVTPLDGGY